MHHYASVRLIGCIKCPKTNHLKNDSPGSLLGSGACFENVEYLPGRGLKQKELLQFGVCNCVQEHHNIILSGAAGSGKTYLTCAPGIRRQGIHAQAEGAAEC